MKLKEKRLIKIVIVGASGFGREVLWTLQECNRESKKYEIIGFIDDDKSLVNKVINGLPVIGNLQWFSTASVRNIQCVVAIGDPEIRSKIVKELEKSNVKFATIIHPSVILSEFVEIGEGSIIQAGCILTVNIKIGNHVHVNIDSTVGHDTVVDDFVTINPGVHINGNTTIKTGTYVGSGATMKQRIKLGKWSVIGAGAALIDDVPDFSLYVGIPAKLKKKITVG